MMAEKNYRLCNECTEQYCVCERCESQYECNSKEVQRLAFMKSLENKSFNPEVVY